MGLQRVGQDQQLNWTELSPLHSIFYLRWVIYAIEDFEKGTEYIWMDFELIKSMSEMSLK